jgi:hypothetical protein
METEARSQLKDILEQCGDVKSYLDAIWKMREPQAPGLSSKGWPFKRPAKESYSPPNVTRLTKKI